MSVTQGLPARHVYEIRLTACHARAARKQVLRLQCAAQMPAPSSANRARADGPSPISDAAERKLLMRAAVISAGQTWNSACTQTHTYAIGASCVVSHQAGSMYRSHSRCCRGSSFSGGFIGSVRGFTPDDWGKFRLPGLPVTIFKAAGFGFAPLTVILIPPAYDWAGFDSPNFILRCCVCRSAPAPSLHTYVLRPLPRPPLTVWENIPLRPSRGASEALQGNRGSRHVAAESFQLLSPIPKAGHGSIQGETVLIQGEDFSWVSTESRHQLNPHRL